MHKIIYHKLNDNKCIQAEQEEIVRNRAADQKGLTLKEVRQMEYLSMVCGLLNSWLLHSMELVAVVLQIYNDEINCYGN